MASTKPPVSAIGEGKPSSKTYAQAYTGVRQDSGDPAYFVKMVRDFYDREGITDRKTIVFSDSLDIEHCLEYKTLAEEAGFSPSFGVGTFFTSKPSLLQQFSRTQILTPSQTTSSAAPPAKSPSPSTLSSRSPLRTAARLSSLVTTWARTRATTTKCKRSRRSSGTRNTLGKKATRVIAGRANSLLRLGPRPLLKIEIIRSLSHSDGEGLL